MKRIEDGLKSAQVPQSPNRLPDADGRGVTEMPERRENPRRQLDVGLTIYGGAVGESPFYEKAEALSGNSNGGLILVSVAVSEGQNLLLINNQTSEEQICRVVRVSSRDAQSNEVAVLFPSPNPRFWPGSQQVVEDRK